MKIINEMYIVKRLAKIGLSRLTYIDVRNRYNELHRKFHTWKHIESVLTYCSSKEQFNDDNLFLAIIFHDVVYDPKRQDNEKMSANFFIHICMNHDLSKTVNENLVYNLILSTKDHKHISILDNINADLFNTLNEADMSVLSYSESKLIEYEDQILQEYNFADYYQYKENRLKFLHNNLKKIRHYESLKNYIEHRKMNIAIYPGSFNPFTAGHLNVLEKAEKIFDKVIVAYGNNPEKTYQEKDIPQELYHRQTMIYDGLLTDAIDKLGYDVTVIRGMRNSSDFQYELNQYRWLQELKPGIKVVSIFCDKEYEHVSSSSLRMLEKYGKKTKYKIL